MSEFDVEQESDEILAKLVQDPQLGRFVDETLTIPKVYHGRGAIQLIVLGQDPTVKNPPSRARIKTVLNLDRQGSLRTYLSQVCVGLGLNLDQHVYATNYLKNFFVCQPTSMSIVDPFEAFSSYWLPLLRDELAQFPNVPVITLGEPLLGALVCKGASPKVREYWGYTPRWKSGETGPLRCLEPASNRLGRVVFPFPHQPSLGKQFYRERLQGYIAFVRRTAFR
jgi:hypothetical protein